MRICFLFNHDQIHQVAHSLPIALALSRGEFQGEIVVATTTIALAAEVQRIGGGLIGKRIQLVELPPSGVTKRLDSLLGKVIPASKLLIYRDHLDFFRSFDILIVAEKTSLLLKSRYGLKNLSIIHTRHGAGDRAIGFDKASAGFDHVLCSGSKIRTRLVEEAGLDPNAISIIGYPKFDLALDKPRHRFLPTAEKVVLYNPHPSPHLSSWYKDGHEVFDRIGEDASNGLIFAPHVMLFQRSFVVTIDRLTVNRAGSLPKRYLRGDRVKIDLGSSASTDMTYTRAADVYLGDASSQIYEFLLDPRPCIFLNSHGHDWQGDRNFRHWNAGEVITKAAELPAALARAKDMHESLFKKKQQELFRETFDLTDTPSSVRGAAAIADFADRLSRRQANNSLQTA